ncbi:hypothetical protein BB560_003404 [Smittium megazygosporum]|uniref:Large ribosomal subunit protein uL6 N-terminal domain-containing protein n=1 Tax=Smittium megazygosporum TaxID=133381 RepID=A0A2T9ZC37_9FUNG|nr:hypothetical protein BB560_003404 [Smittium megazygosporum]
MSKVTYKGSLVPGVSRYSRSQRFSKRGLYLIKSKVAGVKKVSQSKEKKPSTKSAVSDLERALNRKPSTLYPAESIPKPKQTRKVHSTATLRSSIKPGTILILLAGRFRGKRVVFLKQLASGLLLVTGPYKVNGVPLRRVNQAYVIATSTSIDISDVKVGKKFDDSYFKREQEEKLKGTEEEFFGNDAKKKETPSHKVADQKVVDSQIIAKIKSDPMLKSYLNASFSLTKGQAPHLMKF